MPAARLALPPPGRVQGPAPHVVLVAHSTSALDRAIVGCSAPARGTVVVGVSPMTQSAGRVYGDILQQMGKGRWTAPEARVGAPERFWAEAWLRGWGVRRVVLHAADHLADAILAEIAAVIADAGAQAWFTFATTGPMLHATGILRGHPRRLDGTALLALLAEDPEPRRVVRRHPELLDREGLASCTSTTAFAAATLAIRHHIDHLAGDGRLQALGALRRTMACDGWQLDLVDEERLLEPVRYNPMRLPLGWNWALLHHIRDTAMPAAAVIAAAGASVVEMLALRGSNIAQDGSLVAVAGDLLPIPPAARVFLRVRLAGVELLGDDTPFLADDWGKAIGPRQLRTTVSATFEEGGLAVPRLATPYRHDPVKRWLERHGLKLSSPPLRGRAAVLFRRPGRRDYTHTYRTPHSHPWRRWPRSSERSTTAEGVR